MDFGDVRGYPLTRRERFRNEAYRVQHLGSRGRIVGYDRARNSYVQTWTLWDNWKSFPFSARDIERLIDPSHTTRGESPNQNVGHLVATQLGLVGVEIIDSGRSEPPVPDSGRWRNLPVRLDGAKEKLAGPNIE